MYITVDFGQEAKFRSDTRLRNKRGKVVQFNSMVDALNRLSGDEWELFQIYVVPADSLDNYASVHCLLRRNVQGLTQEEKDALTAKLRTTK